MTIEEALTILRQRYPSAALNVAVHVWEFAPGRREVRFEAWNGSVHYVASTLSGAVEKAINVAGNVAEAQNVASEADQQPVTTENV